VEHEYDNFRAALGWLIAHRDVTQAQRLAGALAHFWTISGRVSEGRTWLREVLSLPGSQPQDEARASALLGSGYLDLISGELAAARLSLEEGLALGRQAGDDALVSQGLASLGQLA
jgi:hypothetical protein